MSIPTTRRSHLVASLSDEEYRHEFVGSQIRIRLPAQIREMRLSRGWTQMELGERAEMRQARICALERLGYENFSLTTLRRLAVAFDVALKVRFVPFSELVDNAVHPEHDDLDVPSYDADLRLSDSITGVVAFIPTIARQATQAGPFVLGTTIGETNPYLAITEERHG